MFKCHHCKAENFYSIQFKDNLAIVVCDSCQTTHRYELPLAQEGASAERLSDSKEEKSPKPGTYMGTADSHTKSADYGTCPNCHHNIIWEYNLDGTMKRCPNCKYVNGEEIVIPMKTVPGYSQDIEGNIVQPTETFPSGAVRGKDNTPTYTLIPIGALRRLAKIYEIGNIRYPNNQWRKGIPVSNIVDHALEHLMKWLNGSRTEDHLAKVAWAMFSLMYYEDKKILEDDIKW